VPEPSPPRPSPAFVLLGIVVLAPALLATLALDVLSWWGRAEWLAMMVLGVGLVSAPFRNQRGWGPSRTGAIAVALLLVARWIAGGVSPEARLLVLPAGHEARALDRIFEERDAAILGARLLSWVGAVDAPEFPALASLSATAYDDMELELGHRMGSVVLSTFFGHDTGDAFGAYVIEPDGPPRGSMVFLHGYGGNFVLHCWQLAVAARAAGMRTVCPSTEITGHWSSGHGERIARVALSWARRGEVTILAGLSNGAIGASRLAPDLDGDIDGLVLVSGVDPDAADPAVPTLVIQGDDDSMTPPENARAYRDAHAARVQYVEIDGSHLVLLEERQDVRAAITRFLVERQRDAVARRPASAPPE
jgi:predicted esterase